MPGDMSERFDQLTDVVLADHSLCQQLLAITDRRAFSLAVGDIARRHGVDLGPADVEAALALAWRAWFQRWV